MPRHDSARLLEEYSSQLQQLRTGLPERFHATLDKLIPQLPDLFAEDWPLQPYHNDLFENNLHVCKATGRLVGVCDWRSAELGPFGMSLGGLETMLGTLTTTAPAFWRYHPNHQELREQFWTTFYDRLGGASDTRKRRIEAARLIGLFLTHGFQDGHPATEDSKDLDFLARWFSIDSFGVLSCPSPLKGRDISPKLLPDMAVYIVENGQTELVAVEVGDFAKARAPTTELELVWGPAEKLTVVLPLDRTAKGFSNPIRTGWNVKDGVPENVDADPPKGQHWNEATKLDGTKTHKVHVTASSPSPLSFSMPPLSARAPSSRSEVFAVPVACCCSPNSCLSQVVYVTVPARTSLTLRGDNYTLPLPHGSCSRGGSICRPNLLNTYRYSRPNQWLRSHHSIPRPYPRWTHSSQTVQPQTQRLSATSSSRSISVARHAGRVPGRLQLHRLRWKGWQRGRPISTRARPCRTQKRHCSRRSLARTQVLSRATTAAGTVRTPEAYSMP